MACDYRTPTVDYSDYEKDPENCVKVRVDIPGLKKKFMGNDASNAQIELEVGGRSLVLKVTLTDGKKEKFLYEVKQLPDPVVSEKCKTKVSRNDEVVLLLHKESPRRWEATLASVGLETEGH